MAVAESVMIATRQAGVSQGFFAPRGECQGEDNPERAWRPAGTVRSGSVREDGCGPSDGFAPRTTTVADGLRSSALPRRQDRNRNDADAIAAGSGRRNADFNAVAERIDHSHEFFDRPPLRLSTKECRELNRLDFQQCSRVDSRESACFDDLSHRTDEMGFCLVHFGIRQANVGVYVAGTGFNLKGRYACRFAAWLLRFETNRHSPTPRSSLEWIKSISKLGVLRPDLLFF